jgi:ribosome-associated protein
MRRNTGLESIDLARKAVDLASDKQASDILLLDLRPVSILADYFVICTVASERQLKAVLDAIRDGLANEREKPIHVEGNPDSGWVLMDYSDVIVHIFTAEQREHYDLERLWDGAVTVLHLQ